MAGKSVVGLDIGSRFIKAVELSEGKRGYYKITEYAQMEVRQDDSVARLISGLFKGKHFRTNRVVTSVSGKNLITRYITMQKIPDEELKDACKYELGKYAPFELDDVVYDCQRMADPPSTKGPESEIRVLLVAAKRTLVDQHVSILEEAGLRSVIVDVDCFALGNIYEFVSSFSPQGAKDEIVAIVDIGAKKTNINISDGKTSFFTREFYKGGDDITETISKKLAIPLEEAEALKRTTGEDLNKAKDSLTNISDEISHDISLSIDFFENQFDKKVPRVLLVGGTILSSPIFEALAESLRRPVEKWNPTNGLELELDELSKNELMQSAPQNAVALGLASRIKGG